MDQAMEQAAGRAMEEAELIVRSYEEDMDQLKDELYGKNIAMHSLEAENERLRKHLEADKAPLLYFGQEREFYTGEIHDLLLSVLEDALRDIPDRSRKKDVVSDILASNQYRHISKERIEQVKNMLRNYDGMNSRLRSGLEELGFRVEESKKHCKVTYYGDSRYFTVLSSTPSDTRTGKNNAARIIKMAY